MRWGTSYYPELVPEQEWERDLDLMKSAGMDHLRILDFAWTAIEPREGEYAWGWLDRFVGLAHARGLALIMCTPTATPPAWLATQFPEIMIEERSGHLRQWGNRRDVDVDSPIYRHFSVGVARAMAERYGRHPAVIGWQIDNELLGSELMQPECHSRASQWLFRDFLKKRHGSLATLNARWGMRFWCQELSDWGEVNTPRQERPCLGHWLDYCEYFSQSQREFIRLQAEAIRPLSPERWIGHNSTAVFDRGLEHLTYAEACDMVGWDAYGGAAAGKVGRGGAQFSALAHDLFRSAKRRPFWIFETNAFDRGTRDSHYAEMVARGAAGICVWHWRGHRAHVEQGCGTVCDFAGRPIPGRIEQFQALRRRVELVDAPATDRRRPVALLLPQQAIRSEIQPNPYRRKDSTRALEATLCLYGALRRLGVDVDVVRPEDDLSPYRMLVTPSPTVLADAPAQAIEAWIRGGGVLFGCSATAHFDEWGTFRRDLGGPLAPALGFSLATNPRPAAEPLTAELADGRRTACAQWFEPVPRVDGEVLARLRGGDDDGCCAAWVRGHGRGTVVYCAAWGDDLALLAAGRACAAAGVATVADGGLQVGALIDPGGRGTWRFNNGDAEVRVDGVVLPPGGFALIGR